MPLLSRALRGREAPTEAAPEPLQSVAAVLANIESSQFGGELSRREYRELISERRRSQQEAWTPIREAARGRGLR